MTNKLPDPIRTARSGGVVSSPLDKIEAKRREPCDFEHWGKMATWTLPQAHGLCFGIAPIEASHDQHDKLINLMAKSKQPYQQEMFKVWSLIQNAYDSLVLHDTVKPIQFIQWADIHGVSIPKELRDSVEGIEQKKSRQKQQSESSVSLAQMEYIPPYLNLMLGAVKALKLNPEKRILAQEINSWLTDNWPADLEGKSDRIIENMVTLLRRPQDKRGGNIASEKT